MQRKPIIVITATITSLMLAFGTTGGAMASTGATATGMPPLILNRASTPTYPQGAVVTVDGQPLDGFDPALGADDPATGAIEAKTYNVDGIVKLTGLPEGWTVQNDLREHATTGKTSAFYILSDGTRTYRWWFDGATGITHTVDELRGLTLTRNNTPITGVDTTRSQTLHGFAPSDLIGYENAPANWDCAQGDTENGYEYTFTPAEASQPSVTFTFLYDHETDDPADLKGVQAWLPDGSLVTGFDPTDTGTLYKIPNGTSTVTFTGLPEGWKISNQSGGASDRNIGIELAGPNGNRINYLFTHAGDYTYTYSISQLKQVTAKADGQPVNGFDPTVSGEYTVPEDAKVTLDGLPEGWDVKHDKGTLTWTLTSPDGSITVTYTFTVQDAPAVEQHTVTFDYAHDGKTTSVKTDDGKPVGQPKDPAREGYEFTGWLLDGEPYDFNSPVTKDLTLTAGWKAVTPKPETHTVTFDTGEGSPTPTQTVESGKTVTTPKNPTRQGYEFAGWTLDGEPYDFGTPVTRDLTLKAMWEKTDEPATASHTIRFTTGNSPDTTITVKDGQTVPRPKDPTRDGWKFTGWYAADADTPYDFTRPVITDLTLTARWEKTGGQLPGDTNRDGRYTTDDLTALTATQDNEPYKAFSHTIHSYTGLTDPHSVLLHNLPDRWKLASSTTATGVTWRVTAPDGTTVTTYRFSGTSTTAGASGEEQQDGRKPGQSAPIIRQSDTILSRTGANTTAAILLAFSMLMGGITALLTKRHRNGRSH